MTKDQVRYQNPKRKAQVIAAVSKLRKKRVAEYIDMAGGKCAICGYSRCLSALEFHHVDPSKKLFGINETTAVKARHKVFAELAKCVLVCANCHREIHAGMIDNPPPMVINIIQV